MNVERFSAVDDTQNCDLRRNRDASEGVYRVTIAEPAAIHTRKVHLRACSGKHCFP
jgi:hypothetical protein